MAARSGKRFLGVVAVITLGMGVRCQVTLTLSGSQGHMIKGDNFTFTCTQTGTSITNFLYFYNGNVLPRNAACLVVLADPCSPGTSCGCQSQSGSTRTHRFVLRNVSSSDAGNWTCEITGVQGIASTYRSQSLWLSVFDVTPTQLPIPDVLVKPGDTAIFSWTLPDLSDALILFVYNASHVSKLIGLIPSRNTLTYNGFDASRFTYLGDTRSSNMTFTLTGVTAWDAGWYRCGKNSVSDVIRNCGQRLVVLGPPTLPSLTSSNTTVKEGSDVNMTCQSTSTSLPPDHGLTLTYIWTRDGVSMSEETGRRLVLRNVSRTERGRYYACAAQEPRGITSQSSSPVILEVLYGPISVLLIPPSLLYQGAENSSLTDVTCSAVCNPACSYQWLRGDNSVAGEGAVLRLGRLGRGEAAVYSCRAWNGLAFAFSPHVAFAITDEDSGGSTTPSGGCVTAMTSHEAMTSQAGLSVGAAIGVGFAAGAVTSAVLAVASFFLLLRTRQSPRAAGKDCSQDVYYNTREGAPPQRQQPEVGQPGTGSPYESLDGASRLPPTDPSLYRDLAIYEIPRDS